MNPMNQGQGPFSPGPTVWPPPPTTSWGAAEASHRAALERFRIQSPWLVGLFTLITLGIYAAFFVKRQFVVINGLRPDLKLSLPYANGILVVAFLSAGLDLVDIFSHIHAVDTASNALDRGWEIMMLVLTFQVRNAINTMLQSRKGDAYWFSGVFTFLFGVIYLQYKINKDTQQWRNGPRDIPGV